MYIRSKMIKKTSMAMIVVIFLVLALRFLLPPPNLFAQDKSSEETKASLKKAEPLAQIVKLGDVLEIQFELEKSLQGKYPVRLYLKDSDGKTVVSSFVEEIDFINEKKKYILKFKISGNLAGSSFWPDDAIAYKLYMKIADSDEKDAGIIRLYRKCQIFRDGIIVLPGFKIPFYVVLMSFLGAFGYVITSISKCTGFTCKNIWKWGVRLVLGPLLGIFLYSISTVIGSSPDAYIIGALCFGSGFYISPILTKMRDFVYDKLAPDKKIQDDISELDADEFELISRLSISKRAAYYLKKESIVSVADLSATSDDKLKESAKSCGIDETYLLAKKTEAKALDSENVSKLNIPLALMKKFPKGINYRKDLRTLDLSQIKLSSEEQEILNKLMTEAKNL